LSTEPSPSDFLAACRRRPVSRTPVWFMRQAGRALPEYWRVRGTGSMLETLTQPEVAAEITLQPVRRYGVDAAIVFCDIVVPVRAIGFGVEIVKGVGPVVDRPFRSAADLDRLRPLEPGSDVPYVLETVRLLARELPASVPLIGFAGAPFTVASYLIEGGPSKNFAKVKALMHTEPALWEGLVGRLGDMAATFLRAQVEAGAQALQLFDSWAGCLSPAEYERFVLPSTRRLIAGLSDLDVPIILFGVGTGELLPLMATAEPTVMGVDWHVPLDVARERLGPDMAVQGNLDPALCLAPWEVVSLETRDVLRRAGTAPGHVFNLGHGVLPETDPGILEAVVELVHAEGRAGVAR
jgi:uroporphyrinogen decarboxylase